jgi:cell division protein FtsN
MPRDYKYHVIHRRQRKPVSPWLGMIAGLLIGLLAAAIVYLKLLAPQTPQQQAAAPAFMPETTEPPAAAATPKQVKQEEKTPAPSPPKPRFDFYTILPEMEVVIPEEEISGKTGQDAVKPPEKPAAGLLQSEADAKPAAQARGTYFLQTGSFRSLAQADQFRARLTLLGLETSVQKVTINNKDTYHRVRVGPYRDFSALKQARTLLSQQGIESTPVMIRQ